MSTHVLYLALGDYRVRAALVHVERFLAEGHRVTLVTGDSEVWAAARRVPGATTVRVRTGEKGDRRSAARRLLDAPDGPLPGADLLVAGDAQSLPVAWAALRRRPELPLRLEPVEPQGHRPEAADLAVLTPWYPSPNDPFAGAFVQASTAAVAPALGRVSILHTEHWTGDSSPVRQAALTACADRLLDHPERIPVLDSPEGRLTRVPVPLRRRRDYADWVGSKEAMLRKALPTGRIEAPVVHAHTGIYGGVLAIRLARADARIVVTEHATFLTTIFQQPRARKLYRQVLERADAFLCVGSLLRDQIAAHFPQYRHKLQVLPNVIDFDRFAPGPVRDPRMLRWLYLGRLVEHKGVDTLLEAFAEVAAEEPEATLTIVGSGPREADLQARGAQLGLGDRFRILPPVVPGEVAPLMHRHDLLVHPSRFETFGMTIPEAVGTGLPVLAARSPGPEETMCGVEHLAGALMEISDEPRVISAAYRELRERAGELDLPRARQVLLDRYGQEAVGERLLEVYAGRTPKPAPDAVPSAAPPEPAQPPSTVPGLDGPEPGHAVLLAIAPVRPGRVADFANFLAERGVGVHLVTAQDALWASRDLHPAIRVSSLEHAEQQLHLPRLERFVVYRAPRAVLRRAQRAAGRIRGAIAPEVGVSYVSAVHTRLAIAFQTRVFHRTYRLLRSGIIARLARHEVVSALELDRVGAVFVCDTHATTLGWHLAQRYPHLQVTNSLDRGPYERLPVRVPSGSPRLKGVRTAD